MKLSFQKVLSLFFMISVCSSAFPNKIIVDKNTSINTIKKAIALANPYDEIIIIKGFTLKET